ncbi:MAG: hypothetical protein KJ676_09485 [Alphaproteobacteria bacterium]|nr:hypothetical protein [Alphaproteobacteria bacterium]MBU1525282.1 hypothetical protein [Alphaproteobacteria bacterium]MBU2118697.1 hypothetical protein [Alphaproteobacteria bacterium]MBU2352583.1 hypothetical protein [Alphaproteobacteria bacterium]MBU2382283.1 hypothetical protein [Alphaproteobacteria bacterium]
MADVIVDETHWYALKQSANCFVPLVVRAAGDHESGFRNAELVRASEEPGMRAFSAHFAGRVMRREPATHDNAVAVVRAHAKLCELRGVGEPFGHASIVAAVLGLRDKGWTEAHDPQQDTELAAQVGISPEALAHLRNGGRASAAVVGALRDVVAPGIALEAFATSDPHPAFGPMTIPGPVFSLRDLLLPLPTSIPDRWD